MDEYKRTDHLRDARLGYMSSKNLRISDCIQVMDKNIDLFYRSFKLHNFDQLCESCVNLEILLDTQHTELFKHIMENGFVDFVLIKVKEYQTLNCNVLMKLLQLMASFLNCKASFMTEYFYNCGMMKIINEMLKIQNFEVIKALLTFIGYASNDMCKAKICFRFDISYDFLEFLLENNSDLYQTICIMCFNITINSNFDEYYQKFVLFLINHYDVVLDQKLIFPLCLKALNDYTEKILNIFEKTMFLTNVGINYINPSIFICSRIDQDKQYILSDVTYNFVKLILKTMEKSNKIKEELLNEIQPDDVLKGIQNYNNSEITVSILYKLLLICIQEVLPKNKWMFQGLIEQGFKKTLSDSIENGSNKVRIGALRIISYYLSINEINFIMDVLEPQLIQNIMELIDPETQKITVECLECITKLINIAMINNYKDIVNMFNKKEFSQIIDDCIDSNYEYISDKAFKLVAIRSAAFNVMNIIEIRYET